MGAVTPIGNDAETFWRNLLAGTPGGGPITTFDATGFDVRIAAEVKDFDPPPTMDRKMARRMSRFIHFGVAAGEGGGRATPASTSAMAPEQRDRVAVVVNTGGGGHGAGHRRRGHDPRQGPRPGQPVRHPGAVGLDGRGPGVDAVRPDRAGDHPGRGVRRRVIAFQDALRLIPRGECDVVLAGGTEAPLLPMAFAALGNMGALSKRNDEPEGASRPFDRTRDGFVFGEGAGVVVVESAEHALERGATIQAEVVGAALTADAFHISAPEPTGRGAAMAMTQGDAPGGRRARRDRLHRRPRHLDAAQRRHRDAGDQARPSASTPTRSPITSPKSMVGHMLGAAGAAAAIAAIGAIRDGWIPPTINLASPIPSATSTTCRTSRASCGSTRR